MYCISAFCSFMTMRSSRGHTDSNCGARRYDSRKRLSSLTRLKSSEICRCTTSKLSDSFRSGIVKTASAPLTSRRLRLIHPFFVYLMLS